MLTTRHTEKVKQFDKTQLQGRMEVEDGGHAIADIIL